MVPCSEDSGSVCVCPGTPCPCALSVWQVDSIASLGILELFILVAAIRLHRRGYERVNFELLWAEYSKTRGLSHADVFSKPAAARAFQRVLDASLLTFTDARCGDTLPGELQRPAGGP
jgi:hypothetical protein